MDSNETSADDSAVPASGVTKRSNRPSNGNGQSSIDYCYSPIDSSLPTQYSTQNSYVISRFHNRTNSVGSSASAGVVTTMAVPTAPPMAPTSSSTNESSTSPHGSIQAKSTVSSEYTPLLEDFTKKFMESHMANSIPNQQANPSTQLTPPELLLIFQQQSPFNPNLVSSASSSRSSRSSSFTESTPLYPTVGLASGSQHQSQPPHLSSSSMYQHSSNSTSTSSCCWNKFCRFLWYLTNLVLLVSLMTFNFGMLVTPEIYLAFVSVFRTLTITSATTATVTSKSDAIVISAPYSDKQQNNSFLIDLTIVIVIQIVLSIISTISGLILLYATCRIVGTIRKRYHNSFKTRSSLVYRSANRTQSSSNNISSWFVISYELIVAETLGDFCSRLLSLIMTGYFFTISIIYMILLRDFFDMFFASIHLSKRTENQSLFCENHWYLNHDVVSAIWLTLFILLIIGINSLHSVTRRSLQKMFSLSWIKKLSTLIGFFFVVFIIFFVAYLFFNGGSTNSGSGGHREQTFPEQQQPAKLLCLNSDSSFNWKCLEKNWLLLIASIPLLLMPFNMNDLIITLLFTNYNFQKIQSNRSSSPNIRNVLSSSSVGTGHRISEQDILHDNHRAIINRSSSNSRSQAGSGSPIYYQPQSSSAYGIGGNYQHIIGPSSSDSLLTLAPFHPHQPPNSPLLNYETLSPTPEDESQSMLDSNKVPDDSFFKPSSFKQLRNLFITASIVVLLLSIMVNLFVYISYMRGDSSHQGSGSGPDPVVSLDLNFLRKYFETNSLPDDADDNRINQYLMIAASALLLLKTTFLYLLFVFSGLMSGQYFMSRSKNDQLLRPGLCLNGLLFTSPFIVWNCLVILVAILLEFYHDYLHLVILIYGWLGLFVVFIFPSFMLIFLSVKSMSKSPRISLRSSLPTSTIPYSSLGGGGGGSQRIRFRPMPWPKLSLLFGFLLMSIGVFYLIFWIFSFVTNNNSNDGDPRVMSFVPYINHLNSSSIYCP